MQRGTTTGASGALSLFRFSLALMVMAEHLSGLVPAQTGRLAVEAFFCISGFLISMVATTRYAGRPVAFLANRFLRIYPTYWACLAVGLAVVVLVPTSTALHPSLLVPQTAADWMANLAVFGLTQQTFSRLLPAAWSLHTELWFYLVIGLLTAARPRLTLFLLPVSLAVSAYCAFWWSPISFYGTPIGNADAFFIGSTVFLLRDRLKPSRPLLVAGAGFGLFEFLAWGPFVGSQTVNEFLGAPAVGILMLGLWNSRLDDMLRPVKDLAGALGRLSYPLFLLHWPLGALAIRIAGVGQSLNLLLFAGTLTVLASLAVLKFVEDPLLRVRATIRSARPEPMRARDMQGQDMPAISD